MAPIYWLPPVLWMGIIFGLSTDVGSAEHTASWLEPVFRAVLPGATPAVIEALHLLVRKTAHATEYAVLAALWFRAFARGRGWRPSAAAVTALGLSALWALLDEGHQTFVVSRGASLGDVFLDTTGAAAAMLVARFGWRPTARVVTTTLLWIALLGGTGVLVLNAVVGVPSGVLWITAPAAALLLALRRRRTR